MEFYFKKARPVWSADNKNQWNQFVGFVTRLHVTEKTAINIDLTARSYYRLYINGEMKAHGPARTAKGHLRVDQLQFDVTGDVCLAVEVASYNKPDRYSNTIPLEPPLFIAEVTASEHILAATGWDGGAPWKCVNLDYRREKVELLSHSREIMEVYDLTPDWLDWTLAGMNAGAALNVNVRATIDSNSGAAIDANTGVAVDANSGEALNANSCAPLDSNPGAAPDANTGEASSENFDAVPDGVLDWRFKAPTVLLEAPVFLTRRAPYPDYAPVTDGAMINVGDIVPAQPDDSVIGLMRFMQPKWYGSLTDFLMPKISAEGATVFTGSMAFTGGTALTGSVALTGGMAITGSMASIGGTAHAREGVGDVVHIQPAEGKDCYLIWDMGQAVTGFTKVCLKVENDCIVDVINSDRLGDDGITKQNMLIRYHLSAGSYELTSFEPYFFRYIKLVLRDCKKAEIYSVGSLTYWYPDRRHGAFSCSDGKLNAIYEAARRTLQANTLDVFMDCPQRERGGWLCDSLWTARAARMLFGDMRVEEDFIENFMLTDGDFYKNAIFPEVYPGNSRDDSGDPGIINWSFWLCLEICEYYRRSGNKELLEQWYPRIAQFVEGTQNLIGESGLLENLSVAFVDWSQANQPANTQPISLPINCLYAHMMDRLAETFRQPRWKTLAERQWAILKTVPGAMTFGPSGMVPANYADALMFENGEFKPGTAMSEAAMFLDVWCGLADQTGNKTFRKNVIKTMGTCPQEPANVMIGKSDLFIGLTIRYDLLSKDGCIDMLVNEMKDMYLKQLDMGPGTLFENATGYASRCHGFNGHAGVLLMRDVLGLHEPDAVNKTIRIAPHLCGLKWASGRTACGRDEVSVSWRADDFAKRFELNVYHPGDYTVEIVLPDEVGGWEVKVNCNFMPKTACSPHAVFPVCKSPHFMLR